MKKVLKIVGIIAFTLLVIIELDTMQALVFNRSPYLHTREYFSRFDDKQYVNHGIFVDHYTCENITETIYKSEQTNCKAVVIV